MRSTVYDVLPVHVRRALTRFGSGIAIARRKRRLTVAMMAERAGIARSNYARVEKGDARVSLGVYAMVLFVLGFGDALGDLVDPGRDDQGLLLDAERLPKRVRSRKARSES